MCSDSRQPAAGSRQAVAGAGFSRPNVATAALPLLLLLVFAVANRAQAPRFFPDDPIQVDDDMSLDASKATAIEGSNGYDFTEHTFLNVGDRRDVRAMNVNTMDEVPDSSWFTNRIGRREMTLA
ncbi:MAG TPA: hypothetical protein VIX63_00810, partial [Vicinamibacterales bacterium]